MRFPGTAAVLAGAGLGAEVVHQAMLRVGPLSVWIFEEHFTPDATRLAIGSAAFAAMCASVVMLTRTAPPTMSAHSAAQTSPASATPEPGL